MKNKETVSTMESSKLQMSDNDMNIALLKAMRSVWIIEIGLIEKNLLKYKSTELIMLAQGKLIGFKKCLEDLINIIGE